MKPHVPITAAILVPLLALGPSCATAPRQLRLAFIDEAGGGGEEDEGIVAEPVELSDAELAQGFRTLARDPQLIAFLWAASS